MVNTILTITLLVGVFASLFLIAVTVQRCRSEKKNYFIYALIAMLFYVFGNYLEASSDSTGGAFVGVKVMYVGGCLMSPFFLFFVLDYCEVKMPRLAVRLLILLIPALNLFMLWTTDDTGLIYKSFRYSGETPIHTLQVLEQGPAYYSVYGYSILCILVSCGILLHRMFKWGKHYRGPLVFLILSAAAPVLANAIFIVNTYLLPSHLSGVNFTPFALIVTNIFVYIGVLRYDLFDFTPRASTATLDMIRDGLIFLDSHMNYIASNNVARQLFPGLNGFAKGAPIRQLPQWPEALAHLDADRKYEDIRFALEGGDKRIFNAWVNAVETNKRTLSLVVLIQDITKNEALLKQLETAAYNDGLTEIYNHKHFMELATIQLERAKRAQHPCCIIMFDLDFFKKINDTYGHQAGDDVLRSVAQFVKRTVRIYDIFARYGGEEFVIFMSDAKRKDAVLLAERIRVGIEENACDYEGTEIRITTSLGVSATAGELSLDELLKKADEALYTAKNTGRNKVCVAP
ncbi:MAG: diguanylate cyclase [Clostridiales Family XIII bacterium]|nr:diguanylate cyclase [Clostridiales Family XIII bacterium]